MVLDALFYCLLPPHLFASYAVADGLELHLGREYDNGRLLKLLLKLGAVNDRGGGSDGGVDPRWAETGDRYILKLFKGFLFHQVGKQSLGCRPLLKFSLTWHF